jgi:hypothetical protein
MESSRAMTKEEVRKDFLRQIRNIVNYWKSESRTDTVDANGRIEGVAFSILALIDGANVMFPSMDLVMRPHPLDKKYHRKRKENWINDGLVINDDIELHEEFAKWWQTENSAQN